MGTVPSSTHTHGRGDCVLPPNLSPSAWLYAMVLCLAGKQLLKRHLEPFLKPLFLDLSCGSPLTEVAAGKAVGWLRDTLGPNIFAARLTDAQTHALHTNPNIPPPAVSGVGLGRMGGSGLGGGAGAGLGLAGLGVMQPGFGMGMARPGLHGGLNIS